MIITVLAAFGLAYVILDSTLLEPLRRRWWPRADCYFCVGFWAGLGIWFAKHLLSWTGEAWATTMMEGIELGLAACGVSGWLASRMVMLEEEEHDGT